MKGYQRRKQDRGFSKGGGVCFKIETPTHDELNLKKRQEIRTNFCAYFANDYFFPKKEMAALNKIPMVRNPDPLRTIMHTHVPLTQSFPAIASTLPLWAKRPPRGTGLPL